MSSGCSISRWPTTPARRDASRSRRNFLRWRGSVTTALCRLSPNRTTAIAPSSAAGSQSSTGSTAFPKRRKRWRSGPRKKINREDDDVDWIAGNRTGLEKYPRFGRPDADGPVTLAQPPRRRPGFSQARKSPEDRLGQFPRVLLLPLPSLL